jgi:hypothetical protein
LGRRRTAFLVFLALAVVLGKKPNVLFVRLAFRYETQRISKENVFVHSWQKNTQAKVWVCPDHTYV